MEKKIVKNVLIVITLSIEEADIVKEWLFNNCSENELLLELHNELCFELR